MSREHDGPDAVFFHLPGFTFENYLSVYENPDRVTSKLDGQDIIYLSEPVSLRDLEEGKRVVMLERKAKVVSVRAYVDLNQV